MKRASLQFKVLLFVGLAMVFLSAVSVVCLHRVYQSVQEVESISLASDTLGGGKKDEGSAIAALIKKEGGAAVADASKAATTAYKIALLVTAIVLVVSLVSLSVFVRRQVVLPLRNAVVVAESIARGELAVSTSHNSQDEIGTLFAALESMRGSLVTIVTTVRGAAEAVVNSAAQVSVGTTSLSERTEEQASSLEETAASMEELASTVQQNADSARQADEIARQASERARQGGSESADAVRTMNDIKAGAQRIKDIVSVIDGIAFQTNILALNAAVEAARAGEQGRGFAVVASEVRSLAARSAEAAKQVKTLIEASTRSVDTGASFVEKAGATIQTLVTNVSDVSTLMASIADASSEQSRGVNQVSRTVTEMDKVVQSNAASVQEAANAAQGLKEQADALHKAVDTFRLPEGRAKPAAPRAAVRQAAPAMSLRGAMLPVAAPAFAGAAAAGGDNWEEF